MKKAISILLVAGLLASCYEDKGNYNYNFDQMNEITSVAFSPEAIQSIDGWTIELQQPLTEAESMQRIEAVLEQSMAADIENLDFMWVRSYINADGVAVKDSIHTAGYLDVELPVGKEMRYDVLLEVKDRTTTLAKYSKFVVKTRPIFKNSLFVLHGTPNNRKLGNIEVIGNETKVRTDAFQTVYPEGFNPFANAIGLAYSTYYDLSYGNMKVSNNLSIYSSDGMASTYEPFGLAYKFNPNFIYPMGESPVYSRNIETGDPYSYSYYRCVLTQEGKFYTGNHIVKLYKPGEYAYDPNHQTDYKITAATITDNRFVLWDAKNNRFLYVSKSDSYGNSEYDILNYGQWMTLYNPVLDAHVDFSTLPVEASPIGKKAVYAYIQYRENYSESHPFFIFKDEESGAFYRYELTPLATDSGDGKKTVTRGGDNETVAGEPAFSISYQRLRNFESGSNLNLICYNSYFTTDYIFYAVGNNVYRYNVSNGDVTLLYSVPEEYTIVVMKFRVNNSCSNTGDLGYILSLGLNNGTEGAVAEFKLNTASDVDEDFEPRFYNVTDSGEKFGPIQDVQFVHEYMYVTPDYN